VEEAGGGDFPGRHGGQRGTLQAGGGQLFTAPDGKCAGQRGAVAALPGEVLLGEENRLLVERLGRALFGEALPVADTTLSPLRRGYHSLSGRCQVRCMLCSNAGRLRMGAEGPVLEIAPSGHDLFLCETDALAHKHWLQDMKRRFKGKRTAQGDHPAVSQGRVVDPARYQIGKPGAIGDRAEPRASCRGKAAPLPGLANGKRA
jgi:hypothetical protein